MGKRNKPSPREVTPQEILNDCHILLGCQSRGVYLSPAMRLVATMMSMWGSTWETVSEGRVGMDYSEIADRTSLTVQQVTQTIAKLEDVRLVERRADGWVLTVGRWRESVLAAWMGREHKN